jgi:tRNA U34 5-carboxymethylaminomethyl modifying enzyme MnmG/GidA
LDFFKKRIRQFQEKKLSEILSKIQFHQYMKKQAEQKLGEIEYDESNKIRKEISFNEKMIEIWQRNEEKLRKQMRDLEE